MRWGLPGKIALSFSQASHPLLFSWDIMPRLKIGCDSSLCLWGCQSMPGWNCFPRFNLLFMLFLKFLNFKILIFIEVWLIYSCFLLRWSVCLKFLPTLKLGCLSYQVIKVLYIIYIYKFSLGFYTLHIISPSQWLIFTFLMVSFVKLKFKILKSRV